MVKILSLLVLSVLLFAGGLAASLYLRPMLNPEEAEVTPAANNATDETAAPADGQSAQPRELPVPFHGKPMSTDDIFRLTTALRGREREIKRREQELEQQENRMKLAEEDLRNQRIEIDGLLEKVQDTYEKTTLAFQQVRQERAALRNDTDSANRTIQEAKRVQDEHDVNEMANQAQLAQLIEGMSEDSAANLLKSFVNNGQIKVAAQVLSIIEPRNASKILEQLDPDLQNQLSNAYIQRPATKRR